MTIYWIKKDDGTIFAWGERGALLFFKLWYGWEEV